MSLPESCPAATPESVAIGADLEERKVLVRVEPFLSGKILHEEIGQGPEGRDADGFPFEILSSFYVGPHHQGLNHSRHRVRQDHHVGTGEYGGDHRWRSDRRNWSRCRDQRP